MKLSYRIFALDPDSDSTDPKDLYITATTVATEEQAITEANRMLDMGAETVHISIVRE